MVWRIRAAASLARETPMAFLQEPTMSNAPFVTASDAPLRRYEHLYIDGEWVKPIDGELIESIDPATGKPWAIAPMGGTKDIDRAVAAARRAFNGPWRRMPGHERAALL